MYKSKIMVSKQKKLSTLLMFLFMPFISLAQEANNKGLDEKINEAFKPIEIGRASCRERV